MADEKQYPPGTGYVVTFAWMPSDPERGEPEGETYLQAIVRFPGGPPPLTAGNVWNRDPVTIALARDG